MKRTRITPLIVMLLLTAALAACGSKEPDTPSVVPTPTATLAPTPEPSPTPEAADDSLIRMDTDGLVQVHIIDGEAFVLFDFEKWEAKYHIKSEAENFYFDLTDIFGPHLEGKLFPVAGTSGKVKDAAVVQVAALDWIQYPNGRINHSVALLMEDGGVEWVLADPFAPVQGEVIQNRFYSIGRLPWVENIVSLLAEDDGSGMTFIATTQSGERLDLRLACRLTDAFNGLWYTTLITYAEDAPVVGYMRLQPDGSASLSVGYWDSDVLEGWTGTYAVDYNADDDVLSGVIQFDLAVDYRNFDGGDDPGLPQTAVCAYRFTSEMSGELVLSRIEGDALYPTFLIDNPDEHSFRMIYDRDEMLFSDDEGLTYLSIMDGVPTLEHNFWRWEEYYDIIAVAEEFGGVVNTNINYIAGLDGKVVDTVVGKVAAVDWNMFYNFTCPAVFMLQEDGAVKWFLADPISDEAVEYYYCWDVPWLTGIEALIYEYEGEGIGENTAYALDGEGNRYNLSIPINYASILDAEWTCELDAGTKGRLYLQQDGYAAFVIETDGQDARGLYTGSYTVTLAEGQPYRAGILSLTLAWEWDEGVSDGVGDSAIQGSFFFEKTPEGFTLYHADGDSLYGENMTFPFWWE